MALNLCFVFWTWIKFYKDDRLFTIFTSRLPDRKRKNNQEILDKYGLNEYDAYMLLKRSGVRLPIDNLDGGYS